MKLLAPMLVIFLLLSGCAPKVLEVPISDEWQRLKETDAKEEERRKVSLEPETKIDEAKIEVEEILKREREKVVKIEETPFKDILFDFDSYAIKREYYPLLDSISEWLKMRKEKNVLIEGHCDERGTHEYNLILGQKRAEAVKEYLVRKGVDEKRLKTISYGKERPLDPRHTEEAWAKNRRVHFELK